MEDYDYAQVQYRRALYKDDNRVTQERARIPGLQQDYTALQCLLHDTEKALQDLYSLNVVYPAYRGLVPVSMFVQYLASGRCTQLEGHEGCYNLYDSELRQNSIISNLDGIIQKLGELKEAQYELQQAILQSNQDIQRLCDRQLEAYQQHEAIAQYQRQQIADNQRAMERYTFYRDMLTS